MSDVGKSTQLTERQLLSAAGDVVFGRGEGYVRYVRGLRRVGSRVHASIQARSVYLVELGWAGGQLDGTCTCPHFADGSFCQHMVAVGLCVVDASGEQDTDTVDDPSPVDDYLAGLEASHLRDLVRELVARDPSAGRLLEIRASVRIGSPAVVVNDLVANVNDVLRTRGFVDYRASFDVAKGAQEMLYELEGHLVAGAAEAVRPALLRALTRLRKVTEQADDSGGVIGDACQRAADLYARSCREGKPDSGKLARWLAKFRDESPGWPETTLRDFVDAFDDKALAAYRKAVDALDMKYQGKDHGSRLEVDQMLLELADHDGDVDRAIRLLGHGEHAKYGAIIDRLRAAGRDDEVIDWIDRGVSDQRVSARLGAQGRDYWLDPGEVAETYRAIGRVDDAINVLRGQFASEPGASTYAHLVDFAAHVDRADGEREWAHAQARQRAAQPFGNGGILVEIALRANDLDAAWAAANEFGAGHLWQALASASSESRPREAADLYRPRIEDDLRHPNTKLYPGIADKLAMMRDVYEKAGAADEFVAYVDEFRSSYSRRTSLMAALDRKGL